MKILVLDDNTVNRTAAKAQLKEHQVTIVSSYEEAIDLLQRVNMDPLKGYEVVLTDLFMPAEKSRLYSRRTDEYEKETSLPFGMFLAIEALNTPGIKFVGILSDVSHHANALAELYSDMLCSRKSKLTETISGAKMLLGYGVEGSSEGYIQPFPETGDLSEPYTREEISKIFESDRSEYDKAVFTKNWARFLKDLLNGGR